MRKFVNHIVEQVLSEPVHMVMSSISTLMWYRVDISNFRWGLKQESLTKYFQHIPVAFNLSRFDNNCLDNDYAKLPEKFIDVCVFQGTTIWLEYQCIENATSSDGSQLRLTMTLRVLHTEKNIKTLSRFMKELSRESKRIESHQAKSLYRYIDKQSCWEKYDRPHRSFNDVFIPKQQQKILTESIQKFCQSERWYSDHHIPYHFGIMLHGNPGTGKSSVVQVISSLIDCDVFYVTADGLMDSIANAHWIEYRSKDRMRVIIVEDIDTNSFTRNRKIKDSDGNNAWEKKPVSIGGLLNFMDGYGAPDKVIWVMTTNHLDDLDPALVRPGRIDLVMEIGYVNDETFSDFIKYHFGEDPGRVHVRDGVTCADLQTKVMEGWTKEQLTEYVINGGKENE